MYQGDTAEEEIDTIFSMIDECEQISEMSQLPRKLHFLKQYIKALFGRAQSK